MISVILPTYNEVGNIIQLINQIRRNLSKHLYEIIVVDDDSPDGTFELVKKSFNNQNKIRLFQRKKDKGLAKAVRFGIEKSAGDFILVMDTDFNHNPADIPTMIKNIGKLDLIVGSRYIKGGGMENKIRFVSSYLYNLIIRLILRLNTFDNLSGFFLIKREKLIKFSYDAIFKGYGDYFIRLLYFAHKNNLDIKEIPVFYQNRVAGQSKSKFFSMFVDYSKTVLELFTHS